MKFVDCMNVSIMYHRFELFEWLNHHFKVKDADLYTCISFYNEPCFYYYCSKRWSIKTKIEISIDNAAKNGCINVIKYFASKKVNIKSMKLNDTKCTPLHTAAMNGQLNVVEYLVNSGIEVDVIDDGETTPLHDAANCGMVDVAEFLINHGADINGVTGEYNMMCTPLHFAAECNYLNMVKLLVEKGADVNVGDGYGITPLSLSKGEVAEYLRDHGAK